MRDHILVARVTRSDSRTGWTYLKLRPCRRPENLEAEELRIDTAGRED